MVSINKNKKSVVEIQFNWLFVIIVGIIIIIFFVTIAGKYKTNAENELARDVIERLSAISTSAQLSSDTNIQIEIKDTEIEYSCDFKMCSNIGCNVMFKLGKSGANSPQWMKMEPVFAPQKMKSDYIITWSLDWSMPYKVCSILYLTTPGYRYILVYKENDALNKEFARTLLLKLKDNKFISVESASSSQIKNMPLSGEDFTKYVFLYVPTDTEVITIHESVQKSKKWDVIYIQAGENPLEEGIVYYSKLDFAKNKLVPNRATPAAYIGLPLLIGAIYSSDYSNYMCNVHKLMLKYKDVNAVYWEKTRMLYDYYSKLPAESESSICSYYYDTGSSMDSYDAINSSLKSYFSYTLPGASKDYIRALSDSIKVPVSELDSYNEMAYGKDCAKIY